MAHGDWRICIDFGTAASKASVCAPGRSGVYAPDHIHPLRIGAAVSEPNPFVAQSALLFDRGQIYFGAAAVERSNRADVECDPLQSFKTFLGAQDLDAALALRLKKTVDASGAFTQRDALVLYAAYLVRLTERAVALDETLPDHARACPRRYAYPLWRPGKMAHERVAQIFDEASTLAQTYGDALLSAEGVDAKQALTALAHARSHPGDGRVEAGVFEAQAAAECHFIFAQDMPSHVIVFDMGAGTTDLTAFEVERAGSARVMREIPEARQTISLACDEVDRIIVSLIVDKAKGEKKHGARSQLWRRLMRRARRLKESLFRNGAYEVVFEGERLTLRLSDLAQNKTFQSFRDALTEAYREHLNEMAKRAAKSGADTVGVVLAGGGANLPFVDQIVRRTRPASSRIRKVAVQPLVPAWAQDRAFGEGLVEIFPQVAISIGGAVASLPPAEARF
jgi:molecular chaperone DnaK (HSP70)